MALAVVAVAAMLFKPKSRPPAATAPVQIASKSSSKIPPVAAPAAPEVKAPAAGTNAVLPAPPVANIDTNSVSDMLNLGNWMLEQQRFGEAEQAYRRATVINADDEDAHFNLGIALARQARFPEAITAYEKTLEIFPDYLEAKNNLANALIQVGRTNDAMKHLEQAVDLNPNYASALNNLGRLYALRQDWTNAIPLLERARAADPKDLDAAFNLGNARLRKGDAAGAVAAFEAAHALNPDHLLALNMLAQALAYAGKPDRALEYLTNGLERHPESPELLFNIGQLYLRNGRPAEAASLFKQVIAKAPTFAPAKTALKEAEAAAAKLNGPPPLKSEK